MLKSVLKLQINLFADYTCCLKQNTYIRMYYPIARCKFVVLTCEIRRRLNHCGQPTKSRLLRLMSNGSISSCLLHLSSKRKTPKRNRSQCNAYRTRQRTKLFRFLIFLSCLLLISFYEFHYYIVV